MTKTKLTITLSCLGLFSTVTHAQYPPRVKAALEQTSTNRNELKKALNYFYKTGDALEIRSINFLVENMPIHRTMGYYWADEKGRRIAYNELDYPTFNDAVDAFEKLKIKPNLTQNAAISMICVLDDRSDKIEKLALAASEFFDINVTKGLTLLTVRHYTKDIYEKLTTGKKMLLQQRTRETVQSLLQ